MAQIIKTKELNKLTLSSEMKSEDGKREGQLKFKRCLKTDRNFLCCKYNSSRQAIAAGTTLGTLELFSTKTGLHMGSLADSEIVNCNSSCPLTDLTINPHHPDSNVLCCYTSGTIKNWNTQTQICNYTIRENRQILGMEYHPKFDQFVTFGADGTIFLYDEPTYKVIRAFRSSGNTCAVDGHTNRVFSASYHPINHDEFITGGWDMTVQFWDRRVEFAIRHISDVYLCGDGLDINRNGTEILACSWNQENSIRLFDYKSNELLKVVSPDERKSQLYCGKYLGFNYIMTGGTNDNLLRVIDMRYSHTIAMVKDLPCGVYGIGIPGIDKQSSISSPGKESIVDLRNCCFCSGTNLYEIKFIN